MLPRRRRRWHRCRSRLLAHSDRPARHRAPRSGTASREIVASDHTCAPLYVEGFAAAAAPFLVRIMKGKAALQLLLDIIHLGAEDEHDRLRIDEDRHALVFDNLVELTLFIGVFDRVAETGAAARTHANAHPDRRLAALGEERLDPLRRGVRHHQGLLSRHYPISERELYNTGVGRNYRTL